MTKNDIKNLALFKIGGRKIEDFETSDSQEALLINAHYDLALQEALSEHSFNFATKRIFIKEQKNSLSAATISNNANDEYIFTISHSLSSGDKIRIDSSSDENLNSTWNVTVPSSASFSVDQSVYNSSTTLTDCTYSVIPSSEWSNMYSLPTDFLKAIALENSSKNFVIEGNKLLTNETEAVTLKYISKDVSESSFSMDFVNLLATLLASYIANGLNGPASKEFDYRKLYQNLLINYKRKDSAQSRQNMNINEQDSFVLKARMGGIR